MLIVATGVRRSEVCGLKWDMVDLDTSEIEIRAVLVKAGRRLVLKEPKTKSSARRVSLPPALVAHLRTHKAEQAKQKLSAGEAYDDQGFVFAREDGRPINLDALSHTFRATVKDTRFEKFDVHGIRHSHASQLIKSGINIKTISERLGHSTIVITLDTYGHLLPGMDREAASVVDASLTGC